MCIYQLDPAWNVPCRLRWCFPQSQQGTSPSDTPSLGKACLMGGAGEHCSPDTLLPTAPTHSVWGHLSTQRRGKRIKINVKTVKVKCRMCVCVFVAVFMWWLPWICWSRLQLQLARSTLWAHYLKMRTCLNTLTFVFFPKRCIKCRKKPHVSYHFLLPPDHVYCRLDSHCVFPGMPWERDSSSAPSQHLPSALHPDPCHWSCPPEPASQNIFKYTETSAPGWVTESLGVI